eukprot:4632250-Amphidinium_carterae.1
MRLLCSIYIPALQALREAPGAVYWNIQKMFDPVRCTVTPHAIEKYILRTMVTMKRQNNICCQSFVHETKAAQNALHIG